MDMQIFLRVTRRRNEALDSYLERVDSRETTSFSLMLAPVNIDKVDILPKNQLRVFVQLE